jgi:hypothetical protein
MYTALSLIIDALVAAQNNPERFVQECFGERPSVCMETEEAGLDGQLAHAMRKANYNAVRFYKGLDVAYQQVMEAWIIKRVQEHSYLLESSAQLLALTAGAGVVWTKAHEEEAHNAGWGLFAVDGDPSRMEIQRLDELDYFEDDDHARRFVEEGASQGDLTCRLALLIVATAANQKAQV